MQFRRLEPKPVKLALSELVQTSQLEPGRELPLVLTAGQDDVNLAQWAGERLEFIEQQLRQSGALLFRGFAINSTERFQQVVNAVTPQLLRYTERSTPRTSVS